MFMFFAKNLKNKSCYQFYSVVKKEPINENNYNTAIYNIVEPIILEGKIPKS